MKIQCSACEAEEAAVLCCADEAALCSECDRNVHAANKLASKHERVPLSNSSSPMPDCDICQEMVGYFFCLEDRALMCRKCDVAIHTANPNVSSHRRFLLTGVRVGLEPSEPSPSSSMGAKKVSGRGIYATSKASAPMSVPSLYYDTMPEKGKVGNLTPAKRSAPVPLSGEYTEAPPVQGWVAGEDTQSRLSFAGDSGIGSFTQWLLDEFAGLSEFSHDFEYAGHGSSKFSHQAESGKLGNSVSLSIAMSYEDNLDLDKGLEQEPDIAWSVPQVPSPPTTSGPKTSQELMDGSVFVPDIC